MSVWVCVCPSFLCKPFSFFPLLFDTCHDRRERERAREKEWLHQYSDHVTSMYSNAHVSLMSSPIFVYTTLGLIWREAKTLIHPNHYIKQIFFFHLPQLLSLKIEFFSIKYFHNPAKMYFTTRQIRDKFFIPKWQLLFRC